MASLALTGTVDGKKVSFDRNSRHKAHVLRHDRWEKDEWHHGPENGEWSAHEYENRLTAARFCRAAVLAQTAKTVLGRSPGSR
jgi:hypothetical protein